MSETETKTQRQMQSKSLSSVTPNIFIILLFLLTWWLGARALGINAIWYDEWRTIYRAGGAQYGPLSLPQIFERMLAEDPNQSLGYPLLLAIWSRFIGWTDVGARAFSLVAGIPVIAIVYKLGGNLVNRQVGLFSAIALGTSAFYIAYLHEMRTYAIYMLFASIALWAYWQLIHTDQSSWPLAITLIAGITGMLYMHYLGLLFVIGVGLYHLMMVKKSRRWWHITLAVIVAGILFLPWAGVMYQAVQAAIDEGGRPDVAFTSAELIQQFLYAISNGVYVLLIPVIIGITLCIIRPTSVKQKQAAIFVTFIFTATLAATFILHAWLNILSHIRYLLTLWVPFALIVGIAFQRLIPNKPSSYAGVVGITLPALWILSGLWASVFPTFDNHLMPDSYRVFFRPYLPWNDTADLLHDESTAQDAVAFYVDRHPWAVRGPIDFYMQGTPARYVVLSDLPTADFENEVYRFTAGASRVWLVEEQTNQPSSQLIDFNRILAERYIPCGRYFNKQGLSLDLYSVSETCCTKPDTTLLQFDQGITLQHTEFLSTNGDTITLLTGWHVPSEVPVNTYSVALHVLNTNGEIVTQADFSLPMFDYTCMQTTFNLSGLTPGNYTINAIVYDWETGTRLNAINTQTQETGDYLQAATITLPME